MTLLANGIDPAGVPEEFAWEMAAVLEATRRTVPRERYVESLVREQEIRSLQGLL